MAVALDQPVLVVGPLELEEGLPQPTRGRTNDWKASAVQYDAITLDTNVFDRNGLVLESGLLAQMTQFSGGSAQFIMSEIVLVTRN